MATRAPVSKAAKRSAAKATAKCPVAKPAAKRPAAKPAAKRPVPKAPPRAVRAPRIVEDASAPADEIDAIEGVGATPMLGPSRIVWVFRVNGPQPMAIGRLFVIPELGSPCHLLTPRRRLVPGRYEVMFARYGHRWPVTLTSVDGSDNADDMLVLGRVPL